MCWQSLGGILKWGNGKSCRLIEGLARKDSKRDCSGDPETVSQCSLCARELKLTSLLDLPQ